MKAKSEDLTWSCDCHWFIHWAPGLPKQFCAIHWCCFRRSWTLKKDRMWRLEVRGQVATQPRAAKSFSTWYVELWPRIFWKNVSVFHIISLYGVLNSWFVRFLCKIQPKLAYCLSKICILYSHHGGPLLFFKHPKCSQLPQLPHTSLRYPGVPSCPERQTPFSPISGLKAMSTQWWLSWPRSHFLLPSGKPRQWLMYWFSFDTGLWHCLVIICPVFSLGVFPQCLSC